MHFEEVIAPVTSADFIDRYLGEQMLLIPKAEGRFAGLLPWADLNTALNCMRVTGVRMQLVKDGKTLTSDSYLAHLDDNYGSPIKSAIFERYLAEGATLVLNAADELFPAVGRLAEAFEKVFRVRAQVNLYAGWRAQRGFDLHFDDHDTMVLQVHGCKRWKVYRPTRLHPLRKKKDIEPAARPSDDPVWDGVLENGGLLYMPRGWWHVACPLDEPSLHLTVSLSHPTGAQMLAWFVNEMKAGVEARMDVPHLKTLGEQSVWVAAMRKEMLTAWNDTVLDRFMAFWDAKAVSRPDLHLPESAARSLVLRSNTQLRLASGRRLHFACPHGTSSVNFLVEDKPWTCAASLVPALGLLNHLQARSMRELCAAVPPAVAPLLTSFLTALAMGGVVSVDPAVESGSRAIEVPEDLPGR